MTSNYGSTLYRNAPDVSMFAENIWFIYGNGSSYSTGGTSASAPLWAGFTALVNQRAQALGQPYLGFPNPVLYAIAQGPNYNSDFNDINDGSNNGSAVQYPAVTGFDLATGWGSPKTNLIDDLVILANSYTPTPTGTTCTSTPTITLTLTATITATPWPCALVVPSGASVTMANNTYNLCSVNVQAGATLVIGGAVILNLTGYMDVEGTINGNGNGYGSAFAPGPGPGAGGNGFVVFTTDYGAGGGGHGGFGGGGISITSTAGGAGGVTYDSPIQPVYMGSQSGSGSYTANYTDTIGGYGGAALIVEVPSGNVTVNGNIDMNGGTPNGGYAASGNGGGGAGGTLSLDAVGIYGSGNLEANGGIGGWEGWMGGGGGGGRIRVCASNHIPFGGTYSVSGGASGSPYGGNGCYYICNSAFTPTPTSTGTWLGSTPTLTATMTPTSTSTLTSSFTGTPTASVTSSFTATPTPTFTLSYTSTFTQTSTFTPISTLTFTETDSMTPAVTFSPTPIPSSTATPSPTPVPVMTLVISDPYPNPIKGHSPVYFNVAVPGTARMDWSVFTMAFRKIRKGKSLIVGTSTLQWDLKDESGGWVANGLYYLRIQVTIGESNVTQIKKILIVR